MFTGTILPLAEEESILWVLQGVLLGTTDGRQLKPGNPSEALDPEPIDQCQYTKPLFF